MNYILRCKKCKTHSEDIRTNPHAWDGWQVAPHKICFSCIDREMAAREAQVNAGGAVKLTLASARVGG